MTRRSLYAASVTADALSGVLLTGVFNRWGASQYGSVAAWVGALGTIAAVSVALWKAGEATVTAWSRNTATRLNESPPGGTASIMSLSCASVSTSAIVRLNSSTR